MSLIVKDVLKLKGFSHARLVAGKEGLLNVVNNATLMEVPDIFSYVNDHSLLITTLYPISNNNEAINELIPKLARLNLAGICIKPIRYIDRIPSTMINQANQLNFPIIELPEDANLSSLVTEILEVSLNKHIDLLNFRNDVHERLMNIFLRGENINSLVDHLSEIVNLPIILLDHMFKVTCLSKEIADENVVISQPPDEHDDRPIIVRINGIEYGEGSYLSYSITGGETNFGYLVVLNGEADQKGLVVAVQQASLLIASLFYKNYAVLEKERSFQDAFIRDILQGRITSQMEMINKAMAFGWKVEFPQVIIVIKVLNDDERKKKEAYQQIIDSQIIEKTLEEQLSLISDQSKSVYLDDSLVLFINIESTHEMKEKAIEVGKWIINQYNNTVKLGIGISSTVRGLNDLPSAYQEAHNSLKVGMILKQAPFVTHYDDYQMFNIIKEVPDRTVLSTYIENKLGNILKHDEVSDMNLLETLIVLIEENFNAKQAAKRLFIHYNTLRYRIERIKELGINTENGLEVVEIVFAYNVYLWLRSNNNLGQG